MLELKTFQIESASLMSERFAYFLGHPDRPMKGTKGRPFFQALSALTGAGKTPILAQSVGLMRSHLGCEPIVFWMSKAKSVVAQTYNNFSDGKYAEIVADFRVINIQDLNPQLISDGTIPLLILATTGLFNNKEQSEGTLNIYKKDSDIFGNDSPWDRLIARSYEGMRRPLIIVYDEGHNLSEQQTEILAELDADAYLLASATLKLPANFQRSVLQPIKTWVEELSDNVWLTKLVALSDDGNPDPERFLTSVVDSQRVVDAELVKRSIQFDGSTANMELSVDELIARLDLLAKEAGACGLNVRPKAIYVCRTNITDEGVKDDPSLPFNTRKAPPIRIWRHLVEEKGINPKDIAIYANLAFEDGSKPDEVYLYSKGENDFDQFQQSDHQHIIFNLALQEGWDDPACYLAYIDKSMGSTIQVEQIIGRVLRQFNAQHYDMPLLNSAHFFLRVDNESVFAETIEKVRTKLRSEGTSIEILSSWNKAGKSIDEIEPRGKDVELHHVFVDSEAAGVHINALVEDFPIFHEGDQNTIAEARTATQIVDLKEPTNTANDVLWSAGGQKNPVRLRWLVNTAVRKRSSRALAIIDLKSAKFDVRVQVGSKADKQAEKFADESVRLFYAHSELVYESVKPFAFGVIRAPKAASKNANGVYDRYVGFNKFEQSFADAIDASGYTWHRNPSAGGFHIPLLSEGDTSSFYPDFIVWKKGLVYCLDTKGGHLLSDAVARKLFDIMEDGKLKLHVRFISDGKQDKLRGKALKGGFTIWKMKSGTPTPVHVGTMKQAVAEALK